MADNPGGGQPPPSTDELRKLVPDWNLAGDKHLLQLMESMHENMLRNIKSVNGTIDTLMSDLDTASISLQNVNNRFNGLSNTQFIENRVYDDDDEVMVSSRDKKNADEIIPKVNKNVNKEESLLDAKEQELLATSKSLQVLESFYEEIQIVPDSDSESDFSEDDVQISDSIVLQPKNLYADQPLPHIIGSIQWKNKWHVGLVNEESESDSEDEMGVKQEEQDIDLSSSDSEGVYAGQRPADQRDKAIVEARNEAKLVMHNDSEVQTSDDIGSDTDSENYLNHPRSVHRTLETSNVTQKPAVSAKPLSTSTASDFAAELAKKLRGAAGAVVDAPAMEEEDSRRQSASSSAKKGPALKSRFSEKPSERIVGRVFSDEPPPLDSHDNAETDNLFGANDTDGETDDLFADIHNPTNLFRPPDHQSSAYGGLFDNLEDRGKLNSGSNNKEDIFGNSLESENGNKDLFLSGSNVKHDVGDDSKVGGGLFDDILEDEEDDLFGPKKVGKRSKDLVEKKPIGGVSMLGNQNASIAAALKHRRKSSYSSESNESDTSEIHNVAPHDQPLPPKPAPKTIDTPVTNKSVQKPVTNKVVDQAVLSKKLGDNKTSKNYNFSDENDIFADDNLFLSNSETKERAGINSDNSNIQNNMKTHSLFDDLSDDENSLFGQPTKITNSVQSNDSDDKLQVAHGTEANDLYNLSNDNSLFNDTYEHDNALFAKCDSRNANKIKDNEKVIPKSINGDFIEGNLNTGQQGEEFVNNNIRSTLNEARSVLDNDEFKKTESGVSNDSPKVNEETLENELGVNKTKIIETVKPLIEEDIFTVKKTENSIFRVDQSDFDNIFGETKVTSNEKPEMNDLEKALFSTRNSDTVKTSIFYEEPPDFNHVVEDTKTTNVNYLFGEDDEDYYTAFKSSKSFLDDLPSGAGNSSLGYDFLTDEPPELEDEALFEDFPRGSESTKVSNEALLKAIPQVDEKDEFSSTENLFMSTNTNVSKNFDSIFKESDNTLGSSKSEKSDKLFGDLDSDSNDIFGIPTSMDMTQKSTATQPATKNQLSETPSIVKPVVAKRKEILNAADCPVNTPKPKIIPEKPDIINVKPKILNKPTLIGNKTETPKLSDLSVSMSISEIDGASQSSRKPSEEPSPSKTVGKLKISNLNININALKPGASPKKSTPIEKPISDTVSPKTLSKSPEKKGMGNVSKPGSETKNSLPKSISFEAEPETPILSNVISKERARIQVKRRPSSRKARKDALRKSALNLDVTDSFSVPQDSENFTYSLPNSPQSVLDESTQINLTFEKQFRDIMVIKKGEQSTEDDSFESSMDEPKIISTLGKVYQNVGKNSGKSSENYEKSNESYSYDEDELFKKGCKSKEKKQEIHQDLKLTSESNKNESLFDNKIVIASKSDEEVCERKVLEEKINSIIEINDGKENALDKSKDIVKINLENSNNEDYLFRTKQSELKKSEILEQPESLDPLNDDDLFKPKSHMSEKPKWESLLKTDSEMVDRQNADSNDDFLFNTKLKNDVIKPVTTQKNYTELAHDTRELNEEELFKSQPRMTINQPITETEKSLSEKTEKAKPTEEIKSDKAADLFKPKLIMPSDDTQKPKEVKAITNAGNVPIDEKVATKRNSALDDDEALFGAKPKTIPKASPNEDMFKTVSIKKSDPTKKQPNSIFQDSESDDDLFSGKKVNRNPSKLTTMKEKSSVANPSTIFGDEEESFDDLFSGSKKSSAFSKGYGKTKPLFEETNDEDDIFGLTTSSKSKSLNISKTDSAVSTKKTIQPIPSSAEQVFQDPLSLFDED